MKITNIGIVVATRELQLAGRPHISVVIGKPERFPDGSGFYCPFQITGLGDDSIKYGGGEDAAQALMLTLKRIGALLYTSPEATSGLLTWDCATIAGDLGFPVPESLQQQAPLSNKSAQEFRQALNNACGEINEAARLSSDIFDGEQLEQVLRELARLITTIDSSLLNRLPQNQR